MVRRTGAKKSIPDAADAVIMHASGDKDVECVRALFREYADALGIDLSFQHFAQEVDSLPGVYRPPGGTLLLCLEDQVPVGCVGMHRWDRFTCEMKRLYVREAFRGKGYGDALVNTAAEWAREMGYLRIILDSLPSMKAAQKLYARLGFTVIPPYRYNPVAGARFLSLTL